MRAPKPPKCFQQEVAVFVVCSRSKASSLNPLAYRSAAKSIRKHIALEPHVDDDDPVNGGVVVIERWLPASGPRAALRLSALD